MAVRVPAKQRDGAPALPELKDASFARGSWFIYMQTKKD
jgi:hypothetical protein